jgi:hypothetical protein
MGYEEILLPREDNDNHADIMQILECQCQKVEITLGI